METTTDPALQETREYLVKTLRGILADEYVLMNKTSCYLWDSSSPFFGTSSNKIFHKVYDELKKNVEAISEVLKTKTSRVFLSVDDIISGTRLKKSRFFQSKVAAVEMLIKDHRTVIQHLEDSINEFAFTVESECVSLFKMLRDNHEKICRKFLKFVKDIFSYKSVRVARDL